MDPDECLERMRRAVYGVRNAVDEWDAATTGAQLADDVKALDEWLSKGGFPPAEWTFRPT